MVFEKKYGIKMTDEEMKQEEDKKEEEEEKKEEEKPFDLTQVIKLMSPNMHKIVNYKGGYKRVKP